MDLVGCEPTAPRAVDRGMLEWNEADGEEPWYQMLQSATAWKQNGAGASYNPKEELERK
jgi:hypothetical protein